MKALLPALAIIAMICTAIATLFAVVFCLTMGANASPSQIRVLKWWSIGLSVLGLAGIITGVILMRAGKHGWAAGMALSPVALFFIILIVALAIGS